MEGNSWFPEKSLEHARSSFKEIKFEDIPQRKGSIDFQSDEQFLQQNSIQSDVGSLNSDHQTSKLQSNRNLTSKSKYESLNMSVTSEEKPRYITAKFLASLK